MFKNRILLTLFLGMTLFCSACFFEDEPEAPNEIFNAGEWKPTVPFPYRALTTTAFGIESTGKGYVGMFAAFIYNSQGPGKYSYDPFSAFYEYDPVENLWKPLADIPGQWRTFNVSFAVKEKGYVLLGNSWGAPDSLAVYEYDPLANKWTKKQNQFPGRNRYWASSFVIGNKAYVGGGQNDFNPKRLKDFWEYDPAKDSWREIAPLPADPAIRSAATFSINGKGYIVGGYTDNGTVNTVWEYDPVQNKWTSKEPLPLKLTTAIGFSIGDKGFVALGQEADATTTSRRLWEYDPDKNKWFERVLMPGTNRFDAVGFSVGGKGYVGLGQEDYRSTFTTRYFNDFYAYTPYRRPK